MSLSPADGAQEPADELAELKLDEDYKDFSIKHGSPIDDLFEADFIVFSRWLRQDINSRYTRADFLRINRNEAITQYFSILLLVVSYLVLHFHFNEYRSLWRIPFFVLSIFVYRNGQIVHTRMHYPTTMTDSPLLDTFIDWTMMFITGISKEAFHRRHVDEHMTDVSNMARLFGDQWLPFLDLPWIWFLRPFAFFELFTEKKRKQFRLNQKQLTIEAVGLCLYLSLGCFEWSRGSNFLFCYHMLPMSWSTAARLFTGMFCHSAVDRRNSFNSCGFYESTYQSTGLFSMTIAMVNLLTNQGLSNHGIHHAYTQCPVSIINAQLARTNQYILSNFKHARYNNVLSLDTHEQSLKKLPPPRFYDYVIQVFVNLVCITLTMGTVFGFDVSPTSFELPMVDYRIFLCISKAELYANYIALIDSLMIGERAKLIKDHHHYLLNLRKAGNFMKSYLLQHPFPIPAHKLYAPASVYHANRIQLQPSPNYGNLLVSY